MATAERLYHPAIDTNGLSTEQMNAVEIEEAISALAEQPFDAAEFPFAFLQAFGNKETTLKRLRKGESNKSDVGGVLQTNNIHLMSLSDLSHAKRAQYGG